MSISVYDFLQSCKKDNFTLTNKKILNNLTVEEEHNLHLFDINYVSERGINLIMLLSMCDLVHKLNEIYNIDPDIINKLNENNSNCLMSSLYYESYNCVYYIMNYTNINLNQVTNNNLNIFNYLLLSGNEEFIFKIINMMVENDIILKINSEKINILICNLIKSEIFNIFSTADITFKLIKYISVDFVSEMNKIFVYITLSEFNDSTLYLIENISIDLSYDNFKFLKFAIINNNKILSLSLLKKIKENETYKNKLYEIIDDIIRYCTNSENMELLLFELYKIKNKHLYTIINGQIVNSTELRDDFIPIFNDTYLLDNTKYKIFTDELLIDQRCSNKKISKGSYGSIINVRDKYTDREYSIKKYLSCNNSHISKDCIKELIYIKKINNTDTNAAVKIFGIYIENNCVNLVMEKLKYTLENVFNIYNNLANNEKIFRLKELFYQILFKINIIHGVGILHNDLTLKNIMVDDNNMIKIIDFGLSEFFGFNPLIESVNKYLCTEYVKDEISHLIVLENKEFRKIKNDNFKSYKCDIYSIGRLFMCALLPSYNFNKLIFIEDSLYVKRHNKSFIYNDFWEYSPISEILFQEYDEYPVILDFAKKMLSINHSDRWTAKELLNHKFFGKDTIIEINREYTQISSFNVNSLNYFYTPDDIFNKKREILYINKIHNNYINDILPHVSINESEINLIKSFPVITGNIDLIVNGIIKSIILNKIFDKNVNSDILFINKSIFTNDSLNSYIKPGIMIDIFNENLEESTKFYPIMIHITYIIYNLQLSFYDEDKIKIIMNHIINKFIYFIYNYPLYDIDYNKYTIWNLIQSIYYNYCNLNLDCLNLDRNDRLVILMKEIIEKL
jgi:serine/threonine protein kinase